MARSISELCKEAIQVQDAVNPSGIALSMAAAISELRENGVVGTDEIRVHPVTRLYAFKLADLSNVHETAQFIDAYREAQFLAHYDA